MSALVVLLRAINVGGRNKIPMAELRDLLVELGFDNVATYIQSGNVVLSSSKKPSAAAKVIKDGIAERFDHDISVIVRTADELSAIIDGFPYPDGDPKSSGVVFFDADLAGELDTARFAPDECKIAGPNVYVNCPTRFADTKLTVAPMEKQTGLSGTRRNWATVLKLQSMVDASCTG